MSKTRNFAKVIRHRLRSDPKLRAEVDREAKIAECEVKIYKLRQKIRKLRTAPAGQEKDDGKLPNL